MRTLKTEAGLLFKLFSLTDDGIKEKGKKKERALWNQHVLYIPKSDNQKCYGEYWIWIGSASRVRFWLSTQCRKNSQCCLWDGFYICQYQWFVILTQFASGLQATCLCQTDSRVCFCILIHLVCYIFVVLSAFTSCLVCGSAGLHFILVLEMCVVQLLEDVKVSFQFGFRSCFCKEKGKVQKNNNVFNINP